MSTRNVVLTGLAAVGIFATVTVVAPCSDDGPRGLPEAASPDASELGVLLLDVSDALSASERAAFLAELPVPAALNSEHSEAEGLYRLDTQHLAPSARAALLRALGADPRTEFVEPEAIFALDVTAVPFDGPADATATTVNDPLYPFQWHFDQIGLEDAWKAAQGNGAVVAVIDTGVAFGDEGAFRQVRDLSGTSFVPGYDFVSDDDAPHDEHGHGTHVAGTIAQTTNNGYGVAGIAPAARIMPIRVLDAQGRGNTADIAESIRWAADHGADIINMSLGGPLPSSIMQDAVNYASRKGVTIIAAAGNNGWSMPSYPAAYQHVFSVAATQYDRTTTFYSNYGRSIDIAAPGGNVRVDQNDDGRPDGVMQETLARGNPRAHEFALYMGTSMASPHVAGVAALVHGAGVTHPDRLEAVLQATASKDVPNFDRDRYGAGLLDAGAAVAAVSERIHIPRAVGAALLASILLLAAPRRRSLAMVSAGLAAALTAGGAAIVLTPLAAIGMTVEPAAGFAAAPMLWGASLAHIGWLTNALFLSAAPIVAAYALFGGAKRPAGRALLIGAMVGATCLLGFEAIAPTVDVSGIPGTGLLDRVWLAGNALLAGTITWVGSRPR